MSSLLLSREEQGIVIFHVWKSLTYQVRLMLSIFLILIGFVLQYFSLNAMPGILFVFGGNLLLLVKGYDNRIKLGGYSHDAEWVKTDKEQFDDIININRKARKWDVSAFDITSGQGVGMFILSIIVLIMILAADIFSSEQLSFILVANIAVLLYPHWFTGVKRITTTPKLVNKINLFKGVLKGFADSLAEDKIDYLIYVKGKDQKYPTDTKLKIQFKNQPEGFMGMYAQISLNNVQGKGYRYFYVVLVAKEGFGLSNYYQSISTKSNVIKEQSHQDGVEIIVIRQFTTKNSGYHTNMHAIHNIMADGIKAGRAIVQK